MPQATAPARQSRRKAQRHSTYRIAQQAAHHSIGVPMASTSRAHFWPASAGQPKGNPQDEAAIQKNAEAFVAAFHKGDAKALAAFWTPDGDYTDLTGRRRTGRGACDRQPDRERRVQQADVDDRQGDDRHVLRDDQHHRRDHQRR